MGGCERVRREGIIKRDRGGAWEEGSRGGGGSGEQGGSYTRVLGADCFPRVGYRLLESRVPISFAVRTHGPWVCWMLISVGCFVG